MAKTIFKVLYLAFAAVLAVVVFSFNYQSNQYNAVISKVNTAINKENYSDVARIFGGAFDSTNILTETKYDKFNMVLYAGTKENVLDFSTEEELKADEKIDYVFHKLEGTDYTYHRFEKAYYLYLFDVNFRIADVSSNDEVKNASGIRFIGENDETFDFLFKITSSVNSDSYIKTADNMKDTVLYKDYSSSGKQADRNYIQTLNNFRVLPLTLDELKLSYISNELGASIKGFNVLDSEGFEVLENNIEFSFEFNEQFYVDGKDVFDAYDKFVPIYENYNNKKFSVLSEDTEIISKEAYKIETSLFNTATDTFANEIKEGTYPNYKLAMREGEIFGSSIIWRTIGIEALYVFVVAIIYILIFKFSWIKRVVFRQKEPVFKAKQSKVNKKEEK